MNPSTSLGTRSNVGMAKSSPPVRQAGNIWYLLEIHGVCRRSVPSGCAQVKYKCRCRVNMEVDQGGEGLEIPGRHPCAPCWIGKHMLQHQRVDVDERNLEEMEGQHCDFLVFE